MRFERGSNAIFGVVVVVLMALGIASGFRVASGLGLGDDPDSSSQSTTSTTPMPTNLEPASGPVEGVTVGPRCTVLKASMPIAKPGFLYGVGGITQESLDQLNTIGDLDRTPRIYEDLGLDGPRPPPDKPGIVILTDKVLMNDSDGLPGPDARLPDMLEKLKLGNERSLVIMLGSDATAQKMLQDTGNPAVILSSDESRRVQLSDPDSVSNIGPLSGIETVVAAIIKSGTKACDP